VGAVSGMLCVLCQSRNKPRVKWIKSIYQDAERPTEVPTQGVGTRVRLALSFWRSTNGHEVDFLLGEKTAIEVKASRRISKNDFKGLKYLKEEGIFQHLILVSQDPISAHMDGILTLPWQKFLKNLWEDKFL